MQIVPSGCPSDPQSPPCDTLGPNCGPQCPHQGSSQRPNCTSRTQRVQSASRHPPASGPVRHPHFPRPLPHFNPSSTQRPSKRSRHPPASLGPPGCKGFVKSPSFLIVLESRCLNEMQSCWVIVLLELLRRSREQGHYPQHDKTTKIPIDPSPKPMHPERNHRKQCFTL